MHVKIKDAQGLVKDTETKAVLNTDQKALAAYKSGRNLHRKTKNADARLDAIENEVATLSQQIGELTNLLKSVLGADKKE